MLQVCTIYEVKCWKTTSMIPAKFKCPITSKVSPLLSSYVGQTIKDREE